MDNKKKLVATVGFVVVVGGVLAMFGYLGAQPGPPSMPKGPEHVLRFNLKNELIGVESDPPVDPLQASAGDGFVTDKKAVEARVHASCQSCHATLTAHNTHKA